MRSGTDALPPARVGRGIAPAFAERRSYSEAFGLWLAHANDERRGADALGRAQSCEYLFIMRIRRNGANAMRPLRLILARIMINIEQEK